MWRRSNLPYSRPPGPPSSGTGVGFWSEVGTKLALFTAINSLPPYRISPQTAFSADALCDDHPVSPLALYTPAQRLVSLHFNGLTRPDASTLSWPGRNPSFGAPLPRRKALPPETLLELMCPAEKKLIACHISGKEHAGECSWIPFRLCLWESPIFVSFHRRSSEIRRSNSYTMCLFLTCMSMNIHSQT